MTLWSYAPRILTDFAPSGGLEGLGVKRKRSGTLNLIEPRKNDEHFVSAVIRILPAVADSRVEEV